MGQRRGQAQGWREHYDPGLGHIPTREESSPCTSVNNSARPKKSGRGESKLNHLLAWVSFKNQDHDGPFRLLRMNPHFYFRLACLSQDVNTH